jgi:transketolase
MRTAFIETLFELAKKDERIVLVVGDLGFGVVTRFMQELPKQFVNAGVAEQNMTGLATGMALSGKIVFTYSIANFPVIRCLEQIRNDVCYHNANVKIVGVGAGMAYGSLGISHHATEDIAIMRSLPNMTVLAPNDPVEAELATRAAVTHGGPCYLRLGRAGEPKVHDSNIEFQLGRAITLREGSDLTIIATGGLLKNALIAADNLLQQGIYSRVLSMHTIKPLDNSAVLAAARETPIIVTVEEHTIIGGLGGAVAEILSEISSPKATLVRIGLKDDFSCEVGDQEYLREFYGLSSEAIAKKAREAFSRHSQRWNH